MCVSGYSHKDCRLTELCRAANTFVSGFEFRIDTLRKASTTSYVLGLLSATCSDDSSLAGVTRIPSTTSGTFTNGTLQTDNTESPDGYGSFELT